jgi:hypothetical protein
MINEIQDLLKNMLDNLYNLKTYNYYDNSIDITNPVVCNPQSLIPAGTTTGIILESFGFPLFDLKNKYIDYNSEVIRIIDQDDTTGEITLESGFSVDIDIIDNVNIVILDSCYIDIANQLTATSRYHSNIKRNRIYIHVKTKNDSDNKRINAYVDSLLSLKEFNRFIKVNNKYPIRIIDNISISKVSDTDVNLKHCVANFMIEYTTKLKNV